MQSLESIVFKEVIYLSHWSYSNRQRVEVPLLDVLNKDVCIVPYDIFSLLKFLLIMLLAFGDSNSLYCY